MILHFIRSENRPHARRTTQPALAGRHQGSRTRDHVIAEVVERDRQTDTARIVVIKEEGRNEFLGYVDLDALTRRALEFAPSFGIGDRKPWTFAVSDAAAEIVAIGH